MGLPLKLTVVSATVLTTAVMFNLLTPFVMNFSISDLPTIWTSLISWLKPPYLYVVINCIILTIAATSRLQSKINDSHLLSTLLLPSEPVKVERIHEAELTFHGGGLLENQPVIINAAGYNSDAKFVQVPESDFSAPQFSDEDMKVATEAYEEVSKNWVNKSVISMSMSMSGGLKMNEADLSSSPVEKPPVSARFSHRKPAKATTEGGRTLGVTKPKRQSDTLESTWKTITDGRSVPLTRHLRKSDTWETHGQNPHSDEFSINNHSKRTTKSETFDVVVNRGGNGIGNSSRKPPPPPSKLNRSGGSGRLRKDPSLGQEELNRRVEAFINKVNEDMRLQRQESLNRYMEMINRGAH